MKSVVWFLYTTAHNWLSSRRREIWNWTFSGWKGIKIIPYLEQKLGKRFPNFLCLGMTGCSKYHHHWQCSLLAMWRSAKKAFFNSILSFLPYLFTLPERITPLSHYTSNWDHSQAHVNSCSSTMCHPPERDPWTRHEKSHKVSCHCSPRQWPTSRTKRIATRIYLLPVAAFTPQQRWETAQWACAAGPFLSHEGMFWTQAGASTQDRQKAASQ